MNLNFEREPMRTQAVKSGLAEYKTTFEKPSGFKKGDFSAVCPAIGTGEARKIADTFNDIIELSDRTAKELDRVSRVVGKEEKIMHRAACPRRRVRAASG